MSKHIHIMDRVSRESVGLDIPICETCKTPIEHGELYRANNIKLYHVNKDRCSINRRTKRAIELK